MENRLNILYIQCKQELKSIGLDLDNKSVGKIDIKIAPRNCKRYGCCKQRKPVESTKYIEKIGRKRYIKYYKFESHNIEISKWVMDLNEDIIKNTIMHEIIHCLPGCSNHGENFKKYAAYINEKLGYDISRVGDKNKDLADSNLNPVTEHYKYKVVCTGCGYNFLRKRMNAGFTRKYRCGVCRGKLAVYEGVFTK